MNALVLALALAAAPDAGDGCTTRCGLRAPLETQTCESLQQYEDATLSAFETSVGWPRSKTCPTLAGWKVLVQLDTRWDGAWTLEDGNMVLGRTLLAEHTILVGKNIWVDSSLAHEMAHVIEHGLELPEAKGNHERWRERGICAAVNAVSRWFWNEYARPGMSHYRRPRGPGDF